MEIELKPCPFCGGKANIERHGNNKVSTWYTCEDCGASLETGETFNHGAQWNRRASPEPLTDKQKSELIEVCNFYEQDGWQHVNPKIITKRIREILETSNA